MRLLNWHATAYMVEIWEMDGNVSEKIGPVVRTLDICAEWDWAAGTTGFPIEELIDLVRICVGWLGSRRSIPEWGLELLKIACV